jgi:flagellar motor switch protein FliN/FliY
VINTKYDVQNNESLNGIETDTIGEILNISMGAAATAMSIVLNRQVSITTPHVNVIHTEKFEYKELEPAVGIEIEFINGLTGSNIMIMKVADAKKIVNLMISGDSDDTENDEDSLDEMQEWQNPRKTIISFLSVSGYASKSFWTANF